MSLMKSISGIRGTIGGIPKENLTPIDIVKFAAAYGTIIKKSTNKKATVVIGRDGRMSGAMVSNLVMNTLIGLGIDVIDLGYSTTPTVEMSVKYANANGGIILTASHNPKEWNALKLLNSVGEFISDVEGKEILRLAESEDFEFASVSDLGKIITDTDFSNRHISDIVNHPLINKEKIAARDFKIIIDAINSTGATFVPMILDALGVKNYKVINSEISGNFAHNPEPLEEHLIELSNAVVKENADMGIAVDPDVDRLVFMNEDGTLFGEEYTLVAVADYYLSHKKGNIVSNMSSTRALRDITEKHGGIYYSSAVGEVNVVAKMKAVNAVIGGEGNGGIIDPELHYGRDALVGIGLFLTHLANFGKIMSRLKATYPQYFMSKNKINLNSSIDIQDLFSKIKERYSKYPINTDDGIKIEFEKDWIHLRPSNTEPIIRIYTESTSQALADNLAKRIIEDIKELI